MTEPTTIYDRRLSGPHGPIPVRVYRSGAPSGPGLVWLHGGAWMFGDLDMPEADWVSRQLADRGITVVSVAYRLAVDGVHFPIPVDDALASFEWTAQHAQALGIDSARLSIGGASAGANISAGVALRLRDEELTQPAGVVLAYPVLHSALPEPNAELAARLRELPPEIQALNSRLDAVAMNYVGSTLALTDPYAFAANGRLSGLPPMLIVNADVDVLRPSGESFAAAVIRAGGDVALVHEPGTMHGYLEHPSTPGAMSTIDRMSRWILTG